MPNFLQNQPTAALRNAEVYLYEDDGVTPAPLATNYLGTNARRKLSGTTGVLVGVVLVAALKGANANTFQVQFIANGAGTGSVTGGGGTPIVFHFQNGVTTITNAIAALAPFGIQFAGSYTAGSTLSTTLDEFGPLLLAGGTDASLFVRQGGTVWAAAAGTLTNTGIDGDWIYQYTQAELNFVGSEVSLRATKIPDPASLDMSTLAIGVDTVIYDKTAVGSAGNATTLQVIADGAGAGSLDESAYPVIKFHSQTGTTTVKNFEDAVVASAHLGIQAYGTWTTALSGAHAAANFSGGLSYKQDIFPSPMRAGDFDCAGEGSNTYGDLIRLHSGVLGGKVADFTSGTLVFKSLDGSKTRLTVTTDTTGRTTTTVGDLT